MARVWRRQSGNVWASEAVNYRQNLAGAIDEASDALDRSGAFLSRKMSVVVIAAFLRGMETRGITKYGHTEFGDMARHVEEKE